MVWREQKAFFMDYYARIRYLIKMKSMIDCLYNVNWIYSYH